VIVRDERHRASILHEFVADDNQERPPPTPDSARAAQ
jgi:hypothetical protein